MWTYLKLIVKFYHLLPTTPKKTTKLHAVTSTTTTNPVSTYPIIWRKSAACVVQTAIWPTAAKNWMSGHFLWTLICQVYFHNRRDLHSKCTNVRTKQMWKKIFCKKWNPNVKTKQWMHIFELPISTPLLTATLSWKKRKKKTVKRFSMETYGKSRFG